MNTLEQFFSPALTQALGWTLLHSLWQGALLAAVLAGALLLLRRQQAQVRYLVSAGALGALVLVVGLTFAKYYTQPAAGISTAVVSDAFAEPGVASSTVKKRNGALAQAAHSATTATLAGLRLTERGAMPGWLRIGLRYFDRNMPLLVLGWLLGLLAMSLRMLGGLLYVQRLRRYGVRPLGAAWQARLAALAERGRLRRPVALLESALVKVPLVLGHARPVILLPLGAVAGLSPACLEAILAHELAHVLRRDYLVNLLQTVAEVLFFYHPAVWFMANCLRSERENCCDDTATALVGGDPLRLAHALTALAEWSQSAVVPAASVAPRLALAAIGRRGALLERVRRLVQRRPAAPTWGEGVVAALLVLGGLGLLGGSVALAGPAAIRLALPGQPLGIRGSAPVSHPLVTDTSKQKGVVTTTRDSVKTISKTMVIDDNGHTTTNETTANREQVVDDTRERTRIIRRERHEPGTVVIKKDKKGRLTDLVVNGQRVDVGGKAAKGRRSSKDQVTIVTVPSAPPAPPTPPHFSFDFSDDFDGDGPRKVEIRARDFDKAARKMERSAEKLEKSARSFVYVTPGPGRSGRRKEIHINLDDEAINQLVDNAIGVGGASLDIGLRAAAQGLEEARRGLESALRDPDLNADARQEIKRSLMELDRDRQDVVRDRADVARDRADEARDRANELRERRQELQERIRESQEELRELDEARREGPGMAPPLPPRAPRAPRAPRPPRAPRAGMAPLPPAAPLRPLAPLPPRTPAVSSTKVRGMLRNDGLIGKNDKNFQFQLNDDGLKVNGKAQSAEMTAKYRKLLDMPKNGKGGHSINMTVNETD